MNANRAVTVAAVGLFAAASIAAVAAVIAVRSDGTPGKVNVAASASATTSAAPSAPLVDPCVVGLWEAVDDTSYFKVNNTTTVKLTFQPGSVNRVNYGADGSGSGTFSLVMAGKSGRYTVEETIEGESSFTFKTDKAKISRVGQYRNSKYIYKINGTASSAVPLSSFPDVADYACNGDTLTLHVDNAFDRRYRRLAHG